MSHTASPISTLDILLAAVAFVIVAWAFYAAVRYTIWPGEKCLDHIKRRVLYERDEDSR